MKTSVWYHLKYLYVISKYMEVYEDRVPEA